MRISFSHAFYFSIFFHSVLLFVTLPSRRNVIHVPLSVELIKLSQPVKKKKVEKEITEKVKKAPEKKQPKEKKKDDLIETTKEQAVQPVATTKLTLESIKFPYMYYLSMIRKKVAMNWDWPSTKGVYKTVVYFRILQSGEIVDERIEDSSNSELFDLAAVRAIKLSDRFSPLPGGFTDDYLGVFFEFSFRE